MPNLLDTIKRASIEAVEASDPTRIIYGLVESTSPLSILIDQRISIPGDFIVLTRNVSKYTTKLSNPKGSTPVEVEIDNALRTGDNVVLIQAQGGQEYIVLDKVM